MATTLVDGQPAASVTAVDRGLLYGDGVFRTLRVRAGCPLNWRVHQGLLEADCAALGMPCPPEALLREELSRVAPGDAIGRITVTRGSGQRGYSYTQPVVPTRVVSAYPDVPVDVAATREGVRVRRCDLILSEQPRLAGVKSLNRLENVIARAEWQDPTIREGLLADAAGRVIEGTMSNVFAVYGRRLVTPDLSRCGVRGAQRERIRELATAAGLVVDVSDVTFAGLLDADEVFLANSVIGVWPVVALESRAWRPGSLTREIQSLLANADG